VVGPVVKLVNEAKEIGAASSYTPKQSVDEEASWIAKDEDKSQFRTRQLCHA